MAYDFPANPTPYQVFAPPGGLAWTFSNGAWIQTAGSSGSGEPTFGFDTRAEAIGATIAPAVEVIRLNGYFTGGDGGSALYRRVVSQPTHDAKLQSADGAWWELVAEGGECTFEQFGGIADSTIDGAVGTNNYAAWQRAMSFANGLTTTSPANAKVLPRLKFQVGWYYFGQPLDIHTQIHILGRSTGHYMHMGGTGFRFPENTRGICIQHWNTSGSTGPALGTTTTSGTGSIIEGITMQQSGTNEAAHGFQMRYTATFRNCFSVGCPGNAFHIAASVSSSTEYGNANNWVMDNCQAHSFKRHGLYVTGSDVNAGRCYDFVTHGTSGLTTGCGIYDRAYIGSTYIGSQITGYGNTGVHRGGILYALIDEDGNVGGTTVPGTNNRVWYPLYVSGPNVSFPEWVSGTVYRLSLPVWSAGVPSVFIGTYVEAEHPVHINPPGISIGGVHTITNLSANLSAGNIGTVSPSGFGSHRSFLPGTAGYTMNGSYSQVSFGSPGVFQVDADAEINLLTHRRMKDGEASWSWRYEGGDITYGFMNSKLIWHISTPTTTWTYGRSAPVPHTISFVDYALRDPTNTGNWRIHGIRDNVSTDPGWTYGEYARGEIRWNANPVAAGTVGWVCTTGGWLASLWVSGTLYDVPYHVRTATPRFYRLTTKGPGTSTVQPTHTTGTVTGADGYAWLHVGNVAAVWKTFGAIAA